MEATNITIAIVDDHPIVIEGLKIMLNEPDRFTVLSFTSGNAFRSFHAHHKVDVVVLDVKLPDIKGTDLCKEIKKKSRETAVLAFSSQSERSIIMQMLQNGANGYLLKNAATEELIRSISEVLAGRLAFSREVQEIMMHPSPKDLRTMPELTRREHQVLQKLADGATTNSIAVELFVSPLTVETHRRNLLQKFAAKNVAELIKMAMEYRLL